jgi:hypothetical protein
MPVAKGGWCWKISVGFVPPAASGDTTVPLARGTWAISRVDRRGLESKGLRVFVP